MVISVIWFWNSIFVFLNTLTVKFNKNENCNGTALKMMNFVATEKVDNLGNWNKL